MHSLARLKGAAYLRVINCTWCVQIGAPNAAPAPPCLHIQLKDDVPSMSWGTVAWSIITLHVETPLLSVDSSRCVCVCFNTCDPCFTSDWQNQYWPLHQGVIDVLSLFLLLMLSLDGATELPETWGVCVHVHDACVWVLRGIFVPHIYT